MKEKIIEYMTTNTHYTIEELLQFDSEQLGKLAQMYSYPGSEKWIFN